MNCVKHVIHEICNLHEISIYSRNKKECISIVYCVINDMNDISQADQALEDL